jgi:hypothetical protein
LAKKQEHKREDSEWPTNAHLECIVRPIYGDVAFRHLARGWHPGEH